VVSGGCAAHTGAGDPFAPFREVLVQLTGDVEGGRANRLQDLVPPAARAIVTSARDLVGTLLPGAGLLERAGAVADEDAEWLGSLRELVEQKATLPPDVSLQQSAVLSQYARLLRAVAEERPLLVVLEDLHWADSGSIALLAALGRELATSRVLVVASYRPEDVARGRDGERHPLEPVVNELRRSFGDCAIEVGQAAGRAFVDAFLDSEPNRLGEGFRQALHAQTQGHALFTVELLRAMQDRGMVVQDEEGCWVEGAHLDWGALPARVDAVVGERIERLSEDLREALTIASVEGEDFTAEVLSRVRDADTRETIRLLSRELEKRHRLVSARGIRALAEGRLSLYGFSHVLFQRYLYNSLDEVERAQLHEDVGTVLEGLYGDQSSEIAVQLARHFEQAGIVDKAVDYLQQAGQACVHKTANREAIAHLERAIEFVRSLAESPQRDARELALQMNIQAPSMAFAGWGNPRVREAVERALELVERIGDDSQLVPVLFQLANYELCAQSLPRGLTLLERVERLAEEHGDTGEIILASLFGGIAWSSRGDLARGRAHFEEVLPRYDVALHHPLAYLVGLDPAVASLAHLTWLTARMGHLDRALRHKAEALELGARLAHPQSLGLARLTAGIPHIMRGEYGQAREYLESARATVDEHKLASIAGSVQAWMGYLEVLTGEIELGRELLVAGAETIRATGLRVYRSQVLAALALAHQLAGDRDKALEAIGEIEGQIESYGEGYCEPDMHLVRAGLFLDADDGDRAEACLLESMGAARRIGARSLELAAAVTLARLRQAQGRRREARDLLAPVYEWFAEGLDTAPLVEARELLEELSSG
jgi:tetratricopeptide (TPR) repeat protein